MAFRRRPTQGMSNILCKIRGFLEGGSIVGPPPSNALLANEGRAASPLSGVWRIESQKLCGVRSGGRIKFTRRGGHTAGGNRGFARPAVRWRQTAGKDRHYAMVDIGMAAWSVLFSCRTCRFWQLEVLPLLASGAYCTVPTAMALRASCKD